jgi:ribonuclease PH
MTRHDGRAADQLRPIRIERGFTHAAGSVLISFGQTRVLCTASFEPSVPKWMEGKGQGWLTAEYDMLPASTGSRRQRNRGGKVDGRTTEIQRLIGRCLRAIIDRGKLGENTIWLDCDVIQADGGTRTAAITGAYVALCDAITWARDKALLTESPVTDSIAAVSVGKIKGATMLDLDYPEDSAAEVDFNIAMTGGGKFVEVQGSAEGGTFDWNEMNAMIKLAEGGIRTLQGMQATALESPRPATGPTGDGS